MTAAIGLLAWMAATWLVSARLQGAAWPDRLPHVAVRVWLTLGALRVLTPPLVGLALVAHDLPAGTTAATFLAACGTVLEHSHDSAASAVSLLAGLFLLGVGTLSAAAAALSVARTLRRTRHRLGSAVADAGPQRHLLGADVALVPHRTAAAWCTPGAERTVVVTTAALEALSPGEVRQVLAHERAHLDRGHHRCVALAAWMSRATAGRLGTARVLEQVRRLVELDADDRVGGDRRVLARALLAVALHDPGAGHVPAGATALALGASGGDVGHRVRRLRRERTPSSRWTRAGLGSLPWLLVAPPVLLAAALVAGAVTGGAVPTLWHAACDLLLV